MNICKNAFRAILAATLAAGFALTAEAADVKTDKPAQAAQIPIVIEAETLHFNDSTGVLFADGNVIITQGQNKVMANHIDGNTKQSEVWIDGQAHMLQPGVDLTGNAARYNYAKQTGSMTKVAGMVDKQRVAADAIEVLPNQAIIHNGTVTKCPAKVPDYHVSASKVEIWPGEKMIFYNAKFWIKNTVIFSLPKYQKMLGAESEVEFPTIGYNNRNGVYIRQHFEYPLGDNTSIYADPAYYSRSGFKPVYGVINREKTYSLSVIKGSFRDADDNWVKKDPEIKLETVPRKIGSSPIRYTFTAVSGFWQDGAIRSWHQDYLLYFAHDPIQVGAKSKLSIGAGWETIRESYDHSQRNSPKADMKLDTKWSPKWSTVIAYHYTMNNEGLFDFNQADMGKELDFGVIYKLDRLNSIGISHRYDLGDHRVYDRDYTWYHNFHCWDMSVTYREKRKEWNCDLTVTRW